MWTQWKWLWTQTWLLPIYWICIVFHGGWSLSYSWYIALGIFRKFYSNSHLNMLHKLPEAPYHYISRNTHQNNSNSIAHYRKLHNLLSRKNKLYHPGNSHSYNLYIQLNPKDHNLRNCYYQHRYTFHKMHWQLHILEDRHKFIPLCIKYQLRKH